TRMLLGAVTAAAAPTVASLVGDFFPPKERARIYGAVLGGELVGIGIGFAVGRNLDASRLALVLLCAWCAERCDRPPDLAPPAGARTRRPGLRSRRPGGAD